ncbi:hypothetical protein [Paenibacillus sp. FSL H3-0333]|uniref:hypothetical protein n=1 Tax=Paenibacillus sp. FSL H3-0333 TaxID=2921373 RepID=UPI0030F70A48
MKLKYWAALIGMILSILCVFAVDITTFKYRVGRGISGNGNPGLIALALSWTFFTVTLTLLAFIFVDFLKRKSNKLIQLAVATLSATLLISMVFAELRAINILEKNLNGFSSDRDSVVFRFTLINQYTNTLFYNWYILIFGIALALFISCLIVLYGNRKNKNS